MNLYSLAKRFPTEEAALLHLIRTRWPYGVCCVACDHDKCWLVEGKNKSGKPRRLFQCAKCKLQFSATQGTLFHDSHLPLSKWFTAIALMADAKKGMSANQLRRHIGMTYKTAWYVCHRIREAMQEASDFKVGGETKTVEIDETYIGGEGHGKGQIGKFENKSLVLGMAERGGRIHMQKIPNRAADTLRKAIYPRLNTRTKRVVTDGAAAYSYVIPPEKHEGTSHKEELKRGRRTSTQGIENAFSLFKRGLIGNYHQLSEYHLDRYLGEFCWRFNRRGMQPWLFDMALSNMTHSKPLPYRELTKF
jgi:transposase-like protein